MPKPPARRNKLGPDKNAPVRRCHRCRGTGISVCAICGGSGKSRVQHTPEGHAQTGVCAGCFGRKTSRCSACSGRGTI